MADYYAIVTKSVFGIAANYSTVKKYVNGVSRALHQRFDSYEEALAFLLTHVAPTEVYSAGFDDGSRKYRIQYRNGYWGVCAAGGGGVFTSEQKVLGKMAKEEVLAIEHFPYWPDAHSFAHQCPRNTEEHVRRYKLNHLYIHPVSFAETDKHKRGQTVIQ